MPLDGNSDLAIIRVTVDCRLAASSSALKGFPEEERGAALPGPLTGESQSSHHKLR